MRPIGVARAICKGRDYAGNAANQGEQAVTGKRAYGRRPPKRGKRAEDRMPERRSTNYPSALIYRLPKNAASGE
jgi:hypothetical protein